MPDLSPLLESWSQLTPPVTECVMPGCHGDWGPCCDGSVDSTPVSEQPPPPRGLANLPVFQLTCQTQTIETASELAQLHHSSVFWQLPLPHPKGFHLTVNTWRGLSVLQPCGRLFHDSPSKTPMGNPVLTCWAVWAVEQTNHGVGSFIYIFKWATALWETLFHTLYLHNIYQEIILTWGAQFGLRKR